MFRARYRKSFWLVTLGVGLGLLVGIGMTVGTVIGMKSVSQSPSSPLDELKLRASASHGGETFAMATGIVDDGTEGVYMLDYLTGDLTCFVINSRVGKFTGFFKTNVIKELPVEKGKKPSYVMCTGTWNPLRGGPGTRPAGNVVYVADCNTGYFAAYYFPWAPAANINPVAVAARMETLDIGKARDLQVRE